MINTNRLGALDWFVDKNHLDKLNQIREENLMNPELDVEFLCSAIGVSELISED